jgi:hypothetical protein
VESQLCRLLITMIGSGPSFSCCPLTAKREGTFPILVQPGLKRHGPSLKLIITTLLTAVRHCHRQEHCCLLARTGGSEISTQNGACHNPYGEVALASKNAPLRRAWRLACKRNLMCFSYSLPHDRLGHWSLVDRRPYGVYSITWGMPTTAIKVSEFCLIIFSI